MPTYEYRCDACKHTFEIEQRITADRLEKCPECKKKKLVRLVGTGNFILRGGGWYADLYSSTPKKKSEGSSGGESKSESKSDSASGSASGSAETKKTESKSDTKSESTSTKAASPKAK